MTIKSFRGNIADGGQERIYLAGGDGNKGYKIVKLQTIIDEPAAVDSEATLKIYKVKQASATSTINFEDETLLGVSYTRTGSGSSEMTDDVVIFDSEVVNQDLYITAVEPISTRSNNYYIELEEVTMGDAEAANVNFVAALVHT